MRCNGHVRLVHRRSCYLCGRVETVAAGENVEIVNINAVFTHVAENMIGCQKRLGEYPTILLRACAVRENRLTEQARSPSPGCLRDGARACSVSRFSRTAHARSRMVGYSPSRF